MRLVTTRHVMPTLLLIACAATESCASAAPQTLAQPSLAIPTPIIIYVTPAPQSPSSRPSEATYTPSPIPSATATPIRTSTPRVVASQSPAPQHLTGTITFDGEQSGTIEYASADDDTSCHGVGDWSSIKDGATLAFWTKGQGSLLGSTVIGNSFGHEILHTCVFDWAADVSGAGPFYIELANEVYWDDVSTPDSLTVHASTIAALPSLSPYADDIDYYTDYLADDVRDYIGIYIKGVKETDVTEDRMFVWVESDFGTVGVMKDIMYELYDDIAGDISSDWEPDLVIRMGSAYSDGWLQSTTDVGSWWDIDDQLEWEGVTNFEKHGSLF